MSFPRIYHYSIDEEGGVWHEGALVDEPAVLSLFFKNIKPTNDGRFVAFCQGETCYFKAADTALVIQEVEILKKKKMIEAITLFFQGSVSEKLDPSTLFVGPKNVFYCRVRGGTMTARFNRKSYLELAREIRQDKKNGSFFLEVKGQKQVIR
ncbi:MAG: DUF1285 domain-containing protein [Deltaproteobacteria bacterium]|nr:DUF1285 domain-containing protein [Deltaproteobacteria bacterium]